MQKYYVQQSRILSFFITQYLLNTPLVMHTSHFFFGKTKQLSMTNQHNSKFSCN